MKTKLSVREMEHRDLDALADYWLLSDANHLKGMGVDLKKLPTRGTLKNSLAGMLNKPITSRQSYALIWELNAKAVGHCNVNQIEFGASAFMHLHLWKRGFRQKGMGTALVKLSLPYFFENLQLQQIYCEPYTLNPAPNRTLEKIGFVLEKTHTCIPGSLNFEQEVNRWRLTKKAYQKMRLLK